MSVIIEDIVTEEFEYLRHGDRGLKMVLHRPDGPGPFPLVIDIHGGAWTAGDKADCFERDEVLAKSGVAAGAIDFRDGDDGYPTSLQDINYAVRWARSRSGDLRIDPTRIGLCGQSSGGHLAMLAAMRHDDVRYSALALDGGFAADVSCVAMTWPVINPLSRYRHAQRRGTGADPAAWAVPMPARHERYWGDEAAMAEGNPMLALERGEQLTLPPALWVQGQPDEIHDYRDPESPIDGNEPVRFATNYRQAGGEIDLVILQQATRTEDSHAPVADFFRRQLGA